MRAVVGSSSPWPPCRLRPPGSPREIVGPRDFKKNRYLILVCPVPAVTGENLCADVSGAVAGVPVPLKSLTPSRTGGVWLPLWAGAGPCPWLPPANWAAMSASAATADRTWKTKRQNAIVLSPGACSDQLVGIKDRLGRMRKYRFAISATTLAPQGCRRRGSSSPHRTSVVANHRLRSESALPMDESGLATGPMDPQFAKRLPTRAVRARYYWSRSR